ncbi:MAG: DUF4435 domain-containing protein [Paracoccaceae bacterium]|nr:MAG: DUF4435 domain-containing protein [Paracoccaceae bacterium]
MMTFKEALLQKGRSAIAIFQLFRTSKPEPGTLEVFVEGYADKEYYSHVCDRRQRPASFFVCFGKKKLAEIDNLYEQSGLIGRSVLFIRDRDYDCLLRGNAVSSRVFFTCGYSVENYVFTRDSLARFIEIRFGVNALEFDVSAQCDAFDAVTSSVFYQLKGVHARIFCGIYQGRELDLDRLDITGIVRRTLAGRPPPEVVLSDDQKNSIGLQEIDEQEFAQLADDYSKFPPHLGLRGKFLAVVFLELLRAVGELLLQKHKAGEIISFHRSALSSLNSDTVFACAATFAPPTPRLSEALGLPQHA